MQTFFRSFIGSIAEPSYYKHILSTRGSFSVNYYLVLAGCLILLKTIIGTAAYSTSLQSDLMLSAKEVVQDFPPELVLTISPAGITANKTFPLVARMPSVLTNPTLAGQPQNLLVVDPQGEIGALEKYQAVALINNSFLIISTGGNIQTSPLKDFPEIRIDATNMHQLSQSLVVIAQHSSLFTAGFFILTGFMSFFIWRLLYLAGFAFGLWLVAKNTVGTYAKAWQISLHSITLPFLIGGALEAFAILGLFTGWFLVVHAIFTLYIVSRLEK